MEARKGEENKKPTSESQDQFWKTEAADLALWTVRDSKAECLALLQPPQESSKNHSTQEIDKQFTSHVASKITYTAEWYKSRPGTWIMQFEFRWRLNTQLLIQ